VTHPPGASEPGAYGAVLDRVRAGDPAAIEDLLRQAQVIARRYSQAVCGRAPDSDDAMQEALLQTFRNAGNIREPKAFRSWLYRTVKNACLIGRRRKGVEQHARPGGDEAALEVADAAPGADVAVESAEERERVRAALARLAPAHREVVFLRDLEGLSTREVARVLGISEPNVKVRLHRAHAQLKKRLASPD
jgi:RNA polymerase sigma-70 factor (ECF subfamily)